MNTEETAIVASNRAVPTFEINAPIVLAKETALTNSALIAKVTGHDSKVLAVRAQKELKTIVATVEKARKDAKEPLLVAGRQLDNICATFVLDLEKEFGRVSNVVREFDDAERRRVLEEERLQQAELARIEREKQAEIDRLRREQEAREAEARRIQEEADRKAREEREAAAKAIRDANNAKERKAAQELLKQAEAQERAAAEERTRQEAAAAQERAKLEAQTAAIEEKAQDAAYVAAKPVEITKVQGQRTTVDWEITKINEWALMKARPDLVRKIDFDMRAIKDELKRGVKLAGVEAREIYKADVRAGKMADVIEA